MTPTPKEWNIITGALSTAAAEYEKHANEAVKAGQSRIAEQFRRQADEAATLLEKIEQEG